MAKRQVTDMVSEVKLQAKQRQKGKVRGDSSGVRIITQEQGHYLGEDPGKFCQIKQREKLSHLDQLCLGLGGWVIINQLDKMAEKMLGRLQINAGSTGPSLKYM